MSETTLAPRQTESAAVTVTNEHLDLIKRTVANGATDAELKLFLYDCQRRGVHPLDKLIHFTKRSGKYTPITSIDFMRMTAADTGEYAGNDDALFESGPPGSPPLAATVTVYRIVQGSRYPFTHTARWSEYKPEQNDFMWRKMPHTMLGKCAEACALRKAFPKQLAGLYAREEMDQAGLPDDGRPMTRDRLPSGRDESVNPQTGEVVASPTLPDGSETWPDDVHLLVDVRVSRGTARKKDGTLGREWVRYDLTTHRGAAFCTFNTHLGDAAMAAVADKWPVQITAEQKNEKYPPVLVEMVGYVPPPGAEVF